MRKKVTPARIPRKTESERKPLRCYLFHVAEAYINGPDYAATYVVLAYSTDQAQKFASDGDVKPGYTLIDLGEVPPQLRPEDIYRCRCRRIKAALKFSSNSDYLEFPTRNGRPVYYNRKMEESEESKWFHRLPMPLASIKAGSPTARQAINFFLKVPWGKSKNQHALELEQPLLEQVHPNPYRKQANA